MPQPFHPSRRALFGLAAAGVAAAALAPGAARAARVRTNARIVILGAGAAGTAFANPGSTRGSKARASP